MNERKGKTSRATALETLTLIEAEKIFANEAVDQALESVKLSAKDRALVTEMVYGTLRMRNALDWILERIGNRKAADMPPYLRNILRLGAYQILYLARIPDAAAVNESVDLARCYGHKGWTRYTNGVLRNIGRKKDKLPWPDPDADSGLFVSVFYSHPRWLVDRWLKRYGVNTTLELCQRNNEAPPLTIRANTLKTTRKSLRNKFLAKDIEADLCRYSSYGLILKGAPPIRKIEEFKLGLFSVQDEASMMVAPIVSPQPNERILDLCAAPGGKTAHMAEMMNNKGCLLAVDISEKRLLDLQQTCQRLGLDVVRTLAADAARRIEGIDKQSADRVLIDAPCSGTGVLRRRADARWQKYPDQIKKLAAVQGQILSQAAEYVRPGGVLVYSTCSLEPEENEDQIDSFLQRDGRFELDSLQPFLPERLRKANGAEKGLLTLLPHQYDTDGFFMARMKKTLAARK